MTVSRDGERGEGAERAYIGLGSNLGDRRGNITEAIERLQRVDGVEIAEVSALYETQPRMLESQPVFVNACAALDTTLGPEALLEALQLVEEKMGRQRSIPKGPRTIDLDLLLYADRIVDIEHLAVPHPGLSERAFVLVPLCDVAAAVRHPTRGETIEELARRCPDAGWVREI
jgi:2-amino-4-hydroxy-6-hydroxymethyldihydropteridine diphosphokinase